MSPGDLRELFATWLRCQEQLEALGIRSLDDYAEFLYAHALQGDRTGRGTRGTDVVSPAFGRVQVKHRRLPRSKRLEERLHCRNMECGGFDALGAVIFHNDCSIKYGLIIKHDDVWPAIESHQDVEKKISFQQFASLPNAIDVTEKLRQVLHEL